jgi:hypothetical protein
MWVRCAPRPSVVVLLRRVRAFTSVPEPENWPRFRSTPMATSVLLDLCVLPPHPFASVTQSLLRQVLPSRSCLILRWVLEHRRSWAGVAEGKWRGLVVCLLVAALTRCYAASCMFIRRRYRLWSDLCLRERKTRHFTDLGVPLGTSVNKPKRKGTDLHPEHGQPQLSVLKLDLSASSLWCLTSPGRETEKNPLTHLPEQSIRNL